MQPKITYENELQREFDAMSPDDCRDVFANLTLLNRQVAHMRESQKHFEQTLGEVRKEQKIDHSELMRLLVTKEFFWNIVIKVGLPLMFILFSIGWTLGRFSQHIAIAMGW